MQADDWAQLILAAVDQSALPTVLTSANLDWPGPEIVYVNDAYVDLTGFPRDALIGATPRLNQGPATDRAVLDRARANLRAGIAFEGVVWNYRRDGTPYLLEWMVMPVRLTSGTIDYFLSIQRDITARRSESVTPMPYLETSLYAIRNDSDPVTGAQTRASMLRCLQRAIDTSIESGAVTGLIKLQIKRLERLNKVFSLARVNQILRDIAERIAGLCEPGESLARPHEYAVAITIPIPAAYADDVDAYLIARAVTLSTAVMAEAFTIGDRTFEVEVGVGIGRAPADGQGADDLAVLVDEAAYRSSPRDDRPVCWADPAVMTQTSRQLVLERDLRRAVSNDALGVYYQPIVDLTHNQIVGAEALARWPQPAGEPPVGPDEFIPLAESLDLIDRLGRRVFEQACYQLRDWQKQAGNEAFFVSVNVAPRQLMDRNLAGRLVELTRSIGVSPACLKLEITESALEQDFDTVRGVIDDLVAAGFAIALDDFGKGHSSLERVVALPFSLLKVDRSFVWQTPDGRGAGVVKSLIELARHLQLCALGEGVETAAHETFLRDCGYTYAQGYFYGKPAAPEDCSFRLDAVEKSGRRARNAHRGQDD